MSTFERKGNWIRTYTGGKMWPIDPRIEDIKILDIAHALSNICRYTGHSSRLYTVGEHSLHVRDLVRGCMAEQARKLQPVKNVILQGLLHDSAEAYLADVATPVKSMPFMAKMRKYQDAIEQTVYQKYGLDMYLNSMVGGDTVKICDRALLEAEYPVLMGRPKESRVPKELVEQVDMYKYAHLSTYEIRTLFLNGVEELIGSDNLEGLACYAAEA